MAEKVEVVIKIPKYYLTHPQGYTCLAECVRRGTPIPKGHGRLIDEKVAYKKFYSRCLASVATEVFAETPTIIEADEKESDKR